jgi:hypothetical protein
MYDAVVPIPPPVSDRAEMCALLPRFLPTGVPVCQPSLPANPNIPICWIHTNPDGSYNQQTSVEKLNC